MKKDSEVCMDFYQLIVNIEQAAKLEETMNNGIATYD